MSHASQPPSLWFLDGRVTLHLAREDNAAGLSIGEHLLPSGFGPPYHVHHDEDETFYVIEGSLRTKQGDVLGTAEAGDVVFLARGIPHGFRVVSPTPARLLIVSTGGFEAMVRACSRPAETDGLPVPAEPTPEAPTKRRRTSKKAAAPDAAVTQVASPPEQPADVAPADAKPATTTKRSSRRKPEPAPVATPAPGPEPAPEDATKPKPTRKRAAKQAAEVPASV
ncbi:MAG: cupin domain-containing protein, partial [Microvirga sp.]